MSYICPMCNGKIVICEDYYICMDCAYRLDNLDNLKLFPNEDKNFKPLLVNYLGNNDVLNMIKATRVSHDSLDKMDSYVDEYLEFHLGKKDEKLLNYIIKHDHTSILEHFVFQYEIEMPRYLLQEFARHRIGVSMTVKSTRYTLKEIFKTDDLSQFLFRDENEIVNNISLFTLEKIKSEFEDKFQNKLMNIDTIKKPIPETYMTHLFVTVNARALRHMFKLRSHKSAHPDFRKLMKLIYSVTPKVYRDIILYDLDLWRHHE